MSTVVIQPSTDEAVGLKPAFRVEAIPRRHQSAHQNVGKLGRETRTLRPGRRRIGLRCVLGQDGPPFRRYVTDTLQSLTAGEVVPFKVQEPTTAQSPRRAWDSTRGEREGASDDRRFT